MSSNEGLERLLRSGRASLPEPDGEVTRRARARALAAVRGRRPRRLRVAALVGMTLVVAVVLGVGIGSLIAPGGTAASGPVGFGFLPEAGWYALQAASPQAPAQPRVAMAANVPFAAEDVVHGLADPSALPYSTLLSLPPRGVIVVATLTEPDPWLRPKPSTRYPTRTLPLRLRDATPYIEYGTQIRPDEPLGQYQLRSIVGDRFVEVHVYFGTPKPSDALRAEAQRQLSRLVVAAAPSGVENTVRRPSAATTPSTAVLDRTFACTASFLGGVRQIDLRAHKGSGRQGSTWDRPAFAAVETSVSGTAASAIEDELVWITAGPPSATATVVETIVGFTFPMRSWGTLGVNGRLCRGSAVRVPLTRSGLRGGAAGPIDDRWDCTTGRRVLVRVRAVLESRASLKTYRGVLRTTVAAEQASIAVRTQAGKPLMYAQVLESGKSVLFTARSCFPD